MTQTPTQQQQQQQQPQQQHQQDAQHNDELHPTEKDDEHDDDLYDAAAIHDDDSDDDDDNAGSPADDPDTVCLLNVFRIEGRPHRCLYHGGQLVWEAMDDPSRRTVVPLSDVLRIGASVRPAAVAVTPPNDGWQNGRSQGNPAPPKTTPAGPKESGTTTTATAPPFILLHYAARRRANQHNSTPPFSSSSSSSSSSTSSSISATSATSAATSSPASSASSSCDVAGNNASHPPATTPDQQQRQPQIAAPSTPSIHPAANVWRVRSVRLCLPGAASADALALMRRWCRTLRAARRRCAAAATATATATPRRLLVFVNPFGGRRRGVAIWERCVRPLFQLAGLRIAAVVVTQRAGEIRERLAGDAAGNAAAAAADALDLRTVDGIVCIGGDGTVSEVFNGLVERAMWDATERSSSFLANGDRRECDGDDCDETAEPRRRRFPRPRLPVGIIPGGSTDTIAYCLHGTTDIRTAAIHIALGQRTGLDLASVSDRRGRLLRLYASVMSYGYLGDVAADSERFRWMGPHRYDYSGFKKFIANRGYDGEIAIPDGNEQEEEDDGGDDDDAAAVTCDDRPPERSQRQRRRVSVRSHPDDGVLCYENCARCSRRSVESLRDEDDDGDGGDDRETADEGLQAVQKEEQERQSAGAQLRGRLAPGVRRWRILRGRFFMVNGANLSCACARSPNGFSRFSHVGDGRLDLVLVRHTSMVRNLRLLLKLASRSRRISELPFVEIHRVRFFHFRTIAKRRPAADEEPDDSRGAGAERSTPSDRGHLNRGATFASSTSAISTATATDPDAGPEADAASGGAPSSRWNCDGEVLNDAEVFVESHCQLVQVFRRGSSRPARQPPHVRPAPGVEATDGGGASTTLCGWCGL